MDSWATAAAADGGVKAAAAEPPEHPLARCLRFSWASLDAVSFARATRVQVASAWPGSEQNTQVGEGLDWGAKAESTEVLERVHRASSLMKAAWSVSLSSLSSRVRLEAKPE